MRSGISFFDKTVFKKTVTRYWPIWAGYLVVLAFLLPLSALMQLGDGATYAAYSAPADVNAAAVPEWTAIQSFARSYPGEMGVVMTLLAGAFGLMAAMAVFSHLYHNRSANFFGSLPIRREGLFLTHYLAGLAFLLVPNVVIFLLTLAVEAVGSALPMGLPLLAFWLGQSCAECLFFYTFAVVFAQLTGHILAVPVFYGVGNLLAGAAYYAAVGLGEMFCYGFSGMPIQVYSAVSWLVPAARLARDVRAYWSWEAAADGTWAEVFRVRDGGSLIVYAVAAVVLAGVAFLLYRNRRIESAGDVVAVKALRPVFRYGVAVCSGMALGWLTMAVLGSGSEALFMGAAVVWAVAGCFVAQMLLDKTFRVFRKWKGSVAVGLAFCALFAALSLDVMGFETRVPDPEDVESLSVDGMNLVSLGDTGDSMSLLIDDPEEIALFTALHGEAVKGRDGAPSGASGSVDTLRLELSYHLKNGSTLRREYRVTVGSEQAGEEGSAAWLVDRIYTDRELYWRAYEFDEVHEALERGGRISEATWQEIVQDAESVSGEQERYFYGKDAAVLLDAIEKDFWAGNVGVRRVGQEEYWNWDVRRTLSFRVSAPGDDARSWSAYVTVTYTDEAVNTLAALEQVWDGGLDAETPDLYDGDDEFDYGSFPDAEVIEAVPSAVPMRDEAAEGAEPQTGEAVALAAAPGKAVRPR